MSTRGTADTMRIVDKGYRGHDAQNTRRVFISGQKRGVFGVIKRELRRRSAIEPVIGHLKAEGHLGRCYLKGRAGDAANAISAVGYNFRRILAWLRVLCAKSLKALLRYYIVLPSLNSVLTVDYQVHRRVDRLGLKPRRDLPRSSRLDL